MAATVAENAMDVENDETGIPWKERVEDWKENVKNNESDHSDTNKVRKPEAINETPVDSGQPLSSTIEIERSKLYPYRLLIILRLIIVGFFFQVRITNPVENAYALWITAVICEIWLVLAWILDQLPMWFPIDRETYLDRLSIRYERQELSGVDFFVRTEDPLREPPLTTANALLSVLAVDYPTDKVSCYVSDDGSAMITFECLSETAEFAKLWVPFCKEFDIEPRAPEAYFSQKIDYFREKVKPSFVKKRREMKREYEEFKVRINALVAKCQKMPEDGWIMQDGTPWPGNNPHNHPSMIQVFLGHTGAYDINGNELPLLVYTSREKRPGYLQHDKAGAMNALVRISGVLTNSPYVLNLDCTHYINNSKVVREAMCFMMDTELEGNVSYVQFPLRYNATLQGDHYVNQNTVFYDITMKGLDGIQGPFYLGTGCLFRRQALYGYGPTRVKKLHKSWRTWLALKFLRNRDNRQDPETSPALSRTRTDCDSFDLNESETVQLFSYGPDLEKSMGHSPIFIASTLMEEDGGIPESIDFSSLIHEAIHVMTCAYEEKTDWGKEIGWIYGSVTGHIITGMKMHIRGWKSVYCIPARPAFKANAATNLADNLHQLLQWALGSTEILMSRHCPLWYKLGSGRLHWLQRLTYINTTVYPLTSIPIIVYCFLPPVCLLTGKFITPTLDNFGMAWVASLFITTVIYIMLKLQWSEVTVEEWWRNQQYWVIGGVSSHFFAIFQGLLKVLAGIEIASPSTNHSKAKYRENSEEGEEVYAFKWTNLLILPTTLVIVNFLAVVAGISSTINSGKRSWGDLFVKICFALWVLVHLYPFVRGLVGRQNRTPTIVIIWSVLLASIFSLLWFRIDPFLVRDKVPTFQRCTFDCI